MHGPAALCAALAAVLAPGGGARAQVPCSYEVSHVIFGPYCGVLGYSPITRVEINDAGLVAGNYTTCAIGPGEAFLWTPQTGLITLERPEGTLSAGIFAIANDNVLVGAVGTEPYNRARATTWPDGGPPVDLGIPPGGNHSSARGVNAAGQVVGQWGNDIFGPLQAILWQDGWMIDLGPDLGTPNATALDVNEAGRIVGWMGTSPIIDARAFIWDKGKVTELPPIPGGFTSEARAINDASEVVGYGRWMDPDSGEVFARAFYWKDGVMLNLGTLPGSEQSSLSDINDGGVAVGSASGGLSGAIVWRKGVMRDLNDLVPPDTDLTIEGAGSINSSGQIGARGHLVDIVAPVGVILTPVPGAPGDLNCDGVVGGEDLALLIDAWGPCPGCPEDLDGDGQVGITDLLALLPLWG